MSDRETLPDSYLKKFCDVHLNVRDCGFAHPFVTNDGKCGFCELTSLRKALTQARKEGMKTGMKRAAEIASDNEDCECHKRHTYDCCGSSCGEHLAEAIIKKMESL